MNVKTEIKEYWNLRAKDYDKSPGHAGFTETWKEILVNTFKKKARILDVGTGTGFLALLLAELGHEVVGIDLSKGMIEVAKQKARKLGVNVEFELGDAENLPFSDNSFDAVICRHLLWTLPNPQKAIEEWSRVVKPEGKVVAIDGKWFDNSISTKIRRSIGRLAIAIYERRNPLRNHYRKKISKMLPLHGGSDPEKVAEMFRGAGLSNVFVRDLSWVRERMLRDQPFFYRLAWSSRSYFMVEGIKIKKR